MAQLEKITGLHISGRREFIHQFAALPLALIPAIQASQETLENKAASTEYHKAAIFAGHIEMPHPATKEGQGSISASGIPEYKFNDELSKQFTGLKNPSAQYSVRYATENILLAERPKLAKQLGAEVYVEIHHDSAQDKDITRLSKGEQTEANWKELSGFSVIYNPSNPHSHESLRLAQLIADELFNAGFKPNLYHSKDINGERRPLVDASKGIYTGRELVVRENIMPAVIVEAGVIINPFEEKILRQPETQRKIAESIDKAVQKYFAPR